MTDRLVFLPLLIVGIVAGSQFARRASMARAHRDVGGFVTSSALSAAFFLLGLSIVVVPAAWIWLYDHTVGLAFRS